MIYDQIKNLAKYKEFVPIYQKIQSLDFKNLNPGKHDLGEGHYLMIFDTELIKDSLFEYHKAYIDIHLPISFAEKIAFSTKKLTKETQNYDLINDAALGTLDSLPATINVHPNEFILFFPYEIHAPKLIINQPHKQRRVVIKIKV